MTKYYRVIFEEFDTIPTPSETENIILEGEARAPTSRMDFGINHSQQMGLITEVQNKILQLQTKQITYDQNSCPKCEDGKLTKFGSKSSWYYDIFSDHQVKIPRRRCNKCKHMDSPTVTSLFDEPLSGELIKIQSELGAMGSYRDGEKLMDIFSNKERRINNHEKIHAISEKAGQVLSEMRDIEEEILQAGNAKELIINVDGGHINSIEDNKRSFEVMAAAVYRPESIKTNSKNTRNHIVSKHCSASAMSDSQEQMKRRTLIAALKQGLSPQTKVTALCDGAENCWNIIDALEPLSASVDRILDWFHLGMKMQNISLPEAIKPKLTRIKWHLWRGNSARAIQRITELKAQCSGKSADRLKRLATYITNNTSKIVDYRERQKKGLPFTSNLAESTVESLINQRCKGQQHMRWSREGLDPIMQLRAAIASNDWSKNWKTVVESI